MPDSGGTADFGARLDELRAAFAARLGGTLEALSARCETGAALPDRALLEDLHGRLHQLTGSAGTFGFPELSGRARPLTLQARNWLDQPEALTPAAWQAWGAQVRALGKLLETVPTGPAPVAGALSLRRPQESAAQRVVLIEDDTDLGQELARGLAQFGYRVEHHAAFGPAREAVLRAPPDVLVADVMLPPLDATVVLPRLFEELGLRLPLIFVTASADYGTRIAAARAGGDRFLVKPVSVPRLAEAIESVLDEFRQEPCRVLIVDDDEHLAEHYKLTLRAAGMLAERVSDPREVWRVLEELRPDLVLMDLNMPGYSGADVARAIRYDDAWQSLPIVYLSAESDVEIQGRALLGSGADEFLVKPVTDLQLVVGVRARAMRARRLAQLMSQDGLTGLLKHASIKDRLAQETDRARRQGRPLAVVMVDIDHFKKVNDTWGHPVGDQVIKTLGHLLRQRLRRQDSVGRYGGEEFVAVLPDCSAAAALQLLDDIRQRFAEVRFRAQAADFAVTLSAGVASNEQFPDAEGILGAADAALYRAKQQGRNRVCVAPVRTEGSAG